MHMICCITLRILVNDFSMHIMKFYKRNKKARRRLQNGYEPEIKRRKRNRKVKKICDENKKVLKYGH